MLLTNLANNSCLEGNKAKLPTSSALKTYFLKYHLKS